MEECHEMTEGGALMLMDAVMLQEKVIAERRNAHVDYDRAVCQSIARPLFENGLVTMALCELPSYGQGEYRYITADHKFTLLLQGEMEVGMRDKTYVLSPGMLAYCPIDTRLYRKSNGPVWWIYLNFRDTPLMQQLALQGPYVREYETTILLYQLVRSVVYGRSRKDASQAETANEYSDMIWTIIQREVAIRKPAALLQSDKALDRLIADVRTHPTRPWSIAMMTERMHVSDATLRRMMKKHYGASAMGVVTTIRMSHAMGLLGRTDLNVAEVAEKVGYKSLYSFTRLFKQHACTTPGAYRRSIREHRVVD